MVMVIVAPLILCVAAYVWQMDEIPPPFTWSGWVVLFLLAVLLFIKVSGVAIP